MKKQRMLEFNADEELQQFFGVVDQEEQVDIFNFSQIFFAILQCCTVSKTTENKLSKVKFKKIIENNLTELKIHKPINKLFIEIYTIQDLITDIFKKFYIEQENSSSYFLNTNLMDTIKNNNFSYINIKKFGYYKYNIVYFVNDILSDKLYNLKSKNYLDFIQEINKFYFNDQDQFLTNFHQDLWDRIEIIFNNNCSAVEKLKEIKKLREARSCIIQIQKNLTSEELLSHLKSLSPTKFELFSLHFIARLAKVEFPEMQEIITHNGQVGDGGIDGVIKIKQVIGGYEQHFVQCKRYESKTIGRPEVQAFIGAMVGYQANRGIFITTSSFTKQAKEYIEKLQTYKVVLMDGNEIVNYMFEHYIGIKEIEQKPIYTIDDDFFNKFII